jgi:gliding motility-associated-like protein
MKNSIYKFLFLLFTFLTASIRLSAQPKPCVPPAAMTSFCKDACIICDIDGFKGTNNSKIQGIAPPDFCTSFVHNIEWIAFIAGSTDLTIQVSVSNCNTGNGLEVGIYKSPDCNTNNMKRVSNCNTDIPVNTSATFKNTEPLIIGQYYFFVMDGGGGDICDYTVKVLSGTTKVSPLTTSGVIKGAFDVCEGEKEYVYSNDGVVGATVYEWLLDNAKISEGNSVSIKSLTTGVHNLCCIASNVCDQAPPTCQIINVKPKRYYNLEASICTGKCLKVADSTLCKAGDYTVITKAANGCDSTIYVKLKEFQSNSETISVNFCQNDTILIANKPYTKGGGYKDILVNRFGCDSILNITLQEIVCKIKGVVNTSSVKCAGDKTGSITFSITNATPPLSYTWQEITKPLSGTGMITALNGQHTITDLPVGNYLITVNDNFGNFAILQGIIDEPKQLGLTVKPTYYGDYNLLCARDKKGMADAQVTGGVPPYSYTWSNGATTREAKGLEAKYYPVTVTDQLGCVIVDSVKLVDPPAIDFTATFIDPNCDSISTGRVEVANIKGGAFPYTFLLNNKSYDDPNKMRFLYPGGYQLVLKDANGCTSLPAKGILTASVIAKIDVGEPQTIDLGTSTPVFLISDVKLDTIIWKDDKGLSCYNCNTPTAMPYHSTLFNVAVTSKDGCITTDTLRIFVNKNHKVYVPNAFSPYNYDGKNDHLSIFGSKAVAKIISFSVYDRWGNQVYENLDFQPNNQSIGWDGTYRGRSLNADVFTWVAKVQFLDDEIETLSGDAMIVK